LSKYTIYKGSISINGISLTIAEKNNNEIAVEVIPTTIAETNLQYLKVGEIVNIETDLIAKYVENGGTLNTKLSDAVDKFHKKGLRELERYIVEQRKRIELLER
jgi:riboflavin synthase alpha subunit